jgi:hypothetical protein
VEYWEQHPPHAVQLSLAEGPQAFHHVISLAAQDRMYAEQLELANNPQLSWQQARSLIHW